MKCGQLFRKSLFAHSHLKILIRIIFTYHTLLWRCLSLSCSPLYFFIRFGKQRWSHHKFTLFFKIFHLQFFGTFFLIMISIHKFFIFIISLSLNFFLFSTNTFNRTFLIQRITLNDRSMSNIYFLSWFTFTHFFINTIYMYCYTR